MLNKYLVDKQAVSLWSICLANIGLRSLTVSFEWRSMTLPMAIWMISWWGHEFSFFSPAQMVRDWHVSIWPLFSLLLEWKSQALSNQDLSTLKVAIPAVCRFNKRRPIMQKQRGTFYSENNAQIFSRPRSRCWRFSCEEDRETPWLEGFSIF